MSIMPDHWIERMAYRYEMITPFVHRQIKQGVVSYGLSSYGYDLRVSNEFLVFTSGLGNTAIIDPKDFDASLMVEFVGDVCVIPAGSFVLGRTVEYIKMPDNVVGLCVGKSTYARCGVDLNTTPLEPGWRGHVTLEISNGAPAPVKIYANEGIAQVIFFRPEFMCCVTYADRKGKYQNQKGITLPRV